MIKRILIIGLALCGGGLLYWLMQNKQGFILLSIDNYVIQANLWLVVLSLLALWFVVWLLRRLLVGLFGPIAAVWGGRKRRAQSRSRMLTRRGLEAFLAGQWQSAQKYLGKAAPSSDMPLVNYVVAAQAAAELGQKDEAERWLARAGQTGSESAWVTSLTQARMFISQGRHPEALPILRELHARKPRDRWVLKLLAQAYEDGGDWANLGKLLPDLRRYKVRSKTAIQQLEARYYRELLDAEAARKVSPGDVDGGESIVRLWAEVPRQIRRDPNLIFACARALENVGESLQAEKMLRDFLRSDGWEQRFVRLYGLLRNGDAARQLSVAEGWLRAHPDDPDLLLTLGRLCRRSELWGKGRDYLEASLRLFPCPEVYAELAAVLTQLGDVEKSNECYRQGLIGCVATTATNIGQAIVGTLDR